MNKTVTLFGLSMKSGFGQAALFIFLFVSAHLASFAQSGIWSDIHASEMKGTGKKYIQPEKYRALTFDMTALKSYLSNAPMEGENGNYNKTFYFTFPMPDGTNQQFYIVESP